VHGVEVDVDAFWRGVGRPPRRADGRAFHLVRLDAGATVVVTRSS
jgi:hypothetical protein